MQSITFKVTSSKFKILTFLSSCNIQINPYVICKNCMIQFLVYRLSIGTNWIIYNLSCQVGWRSHLIIVCDFSHRPSSKYISDSDHVKKCDLNFKAAWSCCANWWPISYDWGWNVENFCTIDCNYCPIHCWNKWILTDKEIGVVALNLNNHYTVKLGYNELYGTINICSL